MQIISTVGSFLFPSGPQQQSESSGVSESEQAAKLSHEPNPAHTPLQSTFDMGATTKCNLLFLSSIRAWQCDLLWLMVLQCLFDISLYTQECGPSCVQAGLVVWSEGQWSWLCSSHCNKVVSRIRVNGPLHDHLVQLPVDPQP